MNNPENMTFLDKIIAFCLNNKIVIFLLLLIIIAWGVLVAPFDWDIFTDLRNPVSVDAIPDIGENQQIVFVEWPGRSPQDVEDQISYPLTTALLGLPGVKNIRSFSMMGFSTIYIIFRENIEFYWSRSRILEKLNSLPPGTLPDGVRPNLGPDATALGQVFWYTLEGRDPQGRPAGGWDLHELRTIQDYIVRYALMSAQGVSEVASVGGFVQEYQIDVDPDALRNYDITLPQVIQAVKNSNLDVGARTLEINNVEYVIRGIGFVKEISDLENAVITSVDNVPLFIKNVAHVSRGPALRRGALDKAGVEAVGGVVVVRYNENPLQAIQNVKEKIAEIAPGLPQKKLDDGSISQVTIVPFYDRTELIYETLNTLNSGLSQQILITIIVVLLLVMHLRSSILISAMLPLAVLMTFIAMKLFGVDANIVALSGIVIAVGTIVDMGIVITENIFKHLQSKKEDTSTFKVVFTATLEVGGAVMTAVLTTIVSFLPVFTLQAAEGKLFRPLAFTKTFALFSSIVLALLVIPPLAQLFFTGRIRGRRLRQWIYGIGLLLGILVSIFFALAAGLIIVLLSSAGLIQFMVPAIKTNRWLNIALVVLVTLILAAYWMPLGIGKGILNFFFVAITITFFLGFFQVIKHYYPRILRWALDHKSYFLILPATIVLMGVLTWLGFETLFGWLPRPVKRFAPVSTVAHAFPGLGKEFMPSLDEGAFLYMPTTMPHASIGEVMDVLRKQDMALQALPEIESAVGKLGRVESALDPAPVSMIETVIHYRDEYYQENNEYVKYRFDSDSVDYARDFDGNLMHALDHQPYKVKGIYLRDENGGLISSRSGKPFRLWRRALDTEYNPGRIPWTGIQSSNDIWDEIVRVTKIPGTTSAPKLQPIETRLVMLQSGMRAPMGVKVKGPDLEIIENVALEIETFLKEVPSIRSETVQADRVIGKPYLEIHIDRDKIARYGVSVKSVQDIIETAIGGKTISRSVEGRERYPIRIRYPRELRNSLEDLRNVVIPAAGGIQLPLGQMASIDYVRGPQMIKSEDTFLTAYVIFDKKEGHAEIDVVEQAKTYLKHKMENQELTLPAGVSYKFAGNYENQVRAENRLMIIIPVSLFVIFLILYFTFRSVITTTLIFSSIAVAWGGGFLLIWLYGQPWFLDVALPGIDLRQLFQVHPVNLSVAIWVGFLALFGIASDDGVIIATYLDQQFERQKPDTTSKIRKTTVEAGLRRVRPMLMTTATTVLALLPIMTSTGRGSDIMVPMAIPVFGGMLVAIITMFVIPVLYAMLKEHQLRKER
ncbi:AcrB/AcrD/AcrF family protein [candidate division KSB1 bacterium]|nr:AcrB/AcrD/AcrF family protein [candidate division KSB1 bacterium]